MIPFYQQNGACIYHGDCLQVLPALETESVDFVLTDPPYGVQFRGRWDRPQGMIVGDEDPTWLAPAFFEILLTALRNRASFALVGEAKKRCRADSRRLPRRGSGPIGPVAPSDAHRRIIRT